MGSVVLKDYILPDQAKTFAGLRSAGLIDVKTPDESKILKFIQMKPEKPGLVSDEMRKMEFEAFRSWIVKAVKDPNLLAAKHEGKALGPSVPDEVIRHGRKDRVLASFIENVWSERKRCEHCHSPDKIQKQVKEHGEKVSWMKVNDPRGTLDKLLEQKLIDLENPEKSQILTKPTLLVEHKGGRKMLLGDRSYIQFFRFAKDLAATTGGEYQTVEDLPKPPEEFSVNSDHVLRITGVPTRYFKKFVRVDIHPWVEKDKNWSKIRWATGYAMVFARGRRVVWQG